MILSRGLPLFLLTKEDRGGSFLAVQTLHMKRTTLVTLFFAALLGVSAQAQIITNYGPNTYATVSPSGSSYGPWEGSWNGSSGAGIGIGTSSTSWAAQTFLTPSSGFSTVYAYNVQLNVVNLLAPATFDVGLYAWSPQGATSTLGAGNNFKADAGSLVSGSNSTFTVASGQGFNPFGNNFVTGGLTLDPNTIYAIIVKRTDTSASGVGGAVQFGIDNTGGTYVDGLGDPVNTDGSSGDYIQGGLYTFQGVASGSNVAGINFTRTGGNGVNDMAFWVSFDPASLSPVPEPAVNGAIIGGLFVAGLLAWRRYGRKSA